MSMFPAHVKVAVDRCLLKGLFLCVKPQWDLLSLRGALSGLEEQTQETPVQSSGLLMLPYGGQVLVEKGIYVNEGRGLPWWSSG